MEKLLKEHSRVSTSLEEAGIHPILYGSLGVSVYLGNFKDFGDIDLLVEDIWLKDKWQDLVKLISDLGYKLIDEKEHEFENDEGIKVAFASHDVLIRDKVADPIKDQVTVNREGVAVKTLNVPSFINAYLFSAKDGYRKEKRGKNDLEIVELLRKYQSK